MSYPEKVAFGQKYGDWTVVSRGEQKRKHRYWNCECKCGQIKSVAATHLTNGRSTNCGCKRIANLQERRLTEAERNFRRIYWLYKSDAKKRGLAFEISLEDYRVISKMPCAYCGTNDNEHRPRGGEPYNGNGMDRFDNSKGYTRMNVVPCCSFCNYAKRNHTFKDFKNWAIRAAKHMENTSEPPNVPALWSVS